MAGEEAVEENLAETVGKSYSGEESEESNEEALNPYDFNATFQDKIMTLAIRDQVFARRTQGLISPEYFENSATATLIDLAQRHYQRYSELPSEVALIQSIKDAVVSGQIRKELKKDVVDKFKLARKGSLSDREFVADKVAEFARHQAIYRAMMQSTDLLGKKKYDKIADLIKSASTIGANDADACVDYFGSIECRSIERKDKVAGIKPPQGITTGLAKLDKLLYHNGWGREELSVLLGGAKSGKSTGLLFFARNGALAGKNVLYVTLEMSGKIASSRIDASISEIEMKELESHIGEVEDKVKKANKGAGLLYIAEFPTGSLSPSGLRRLIESNAAEGRRFDMVVVDYLDLMTPDNRTNDPIENSKQVYIGVRAIAQEENIAMLSATQSNREGFKSITAKAEHVSDDFNKVRIADLLISINSSDDEKLRGEARLFFAASRNQAGSMMLQVKQDLERMIFIKSIIGVI